MTIPSEEMKIIHLSTSYSGGAGIAARRLNNLLRSIDINSLFVTLSKDSYEPSLGEITIKRTFLKKLFGGIVSKFNNILSKHTYFSLISISAISIRRLKKFGGPKTTIFHVHNWFNLLNIKTIEQLFQEGYHLVFTLHDQRLFTGGCHYSLNCIRYDSSCNKCPLIVSPINRVTKNNLRRLKNLIHRYQSQVTIIAPSKWILQTARSSSILGNSHIKAISNMHFGFNVIDTYSSSSTQAIENDIRIGVANIDKSSLIKGSDLVDQLRRSILESNLDIKILYLYDYFHSQNDPSNFWKDIDYLLVLSRADNSPNVIHEAKINGIPIIGAKVGGITELLNLDYDFLIDMNGNAVAEVLKNIELISNSRKKPNPKLIKANYYESVSDELPKLLNVYKTIIENV